MDSETIKEDGEEKLRKEEEEEELTEGRELNVTDDDRNRRNRKDVDRNIMKIEKGRNSFTDE